MELVVGVDVHKLEHVAAAIDEPGRSRGHADVQEHPAGDLIDS